MHIVFQPTDNTCDLFDSIVLHSNGYADHSLNRNRILPPIQLDGCADVSEWENVLKSLGSPVDIIYASNLLHISPYAVTLSILDRAKHFLAPGSGLLIIYGAFKRFGEFTTASNKEFDEILRGRNADGDYGTLKL